MTIRSAYKPIDLHAPAEATLWPAEMPMLSDVEAVRAARRLWRFSMGSTFDGVVQIARGNRRPARIAWRGNRRLIVVNPRQGWRELVHDLSHWFVALCNPEERPHSKFHARFEAKLVREVIKRGWLDGKLRDAPKAAIEPIDALTQRRRDKLARIDALLQRWDAKQRRAERAIAKLAKQRRYYAKLLA